MSKSDLNPWDFPDIIKAPFSNDHYNIVYDNLNEIVMGAPLSGACFLELKQKKVFIYEECGGPPVWETNGQFIAIPIWTRKFFKGTIQQIGIVDITTLKLQIFSQIFEVLDLKSFDSKIISGQNSPIHKQSNVIFDIEKEKVDRTIDLMM